MDLKEVWNNGKVVLPFGKHLGESISNVTDFYLKWMIEQFDGDDKAAPSAREVVTDLTWGEWSKIAQLEIERRREV